MAEEKKFILVSMEDERSKHLADVLGNPSCKKIIDFLAEKENVSEKDIADSLHMPLNTVEYNLNKLIKAELIEKSKNFFWSKKGKKIDLYKLSNKSIIISPKSQRVSSKIKSILPAVLITGVGAIILRGYLGVSGIFNKASVSIPQDTSSYISEVAEKSGELATGASLPTNDYAEAGTSVFNCTFPIFTPEQVFLWFLAGALFGLLVFAILNWRKL